MAYETPRGTWEKRFQQSHYSYRDYHTATVSAVPTPYTFGENARNAALGGTIYNWPALNDWVGSFPCFGREVTLLCTQDVLINLISLNPYYLIRLNQRATVEQIAAEGIPQTITEIATLIPQNTLLTFLPTYGVSIVFYHPALAGTLNIWIEGNVEGTE